MQTSGQTDYKPICPNSNFKLSQSSKLKKSFEFKSVLQAKNRFVGRYICVDVKTGPSLRFGITASKKYGNSPERNRFKRCVREAFRLSKNLLPPNLELNISPRQMAKKAKMQDIQKELLRLLCKE